MDISQSVLNFIIPFCWPFLPRTLNPLIFPNKFVTSGLVALSFQPSLTTRQSADATTDRKIKSFKDLQTNNSNFISRRI